MPFRIEDPDTQWTVHQIVVRVEDGTFWLTGEYYEMNGEEKMPPKQSAPGDKP